MKFFKENQLLTIVIGVVLLVLLWAFVPGIPGTVPSMNDTLRANMKARYDFVSSIQQAGRLQLDFAGVNAGKGVPPRTWIDAKRDMIAEINRDQALVAEDAKAKNAKGRVDGKTTPLLSLPSAADPRTALSIPMPDYLPVLKGNADALTFKSLYGQQFISWTKLLTKGTLPQKGEELDLATIPPDANQLKIQYDADKAEKIKNLPPGVGGNPGMGGMGMGTNQAAEQKDYLDFLKRAVMNRASNLHMFVEPNAFQRRSWLATEVSPTQQEIFEAFVDSWLQWDLVKAILMVNAAGQSPAGYDVGKAPVKRLTRVMVGINARNRFLNSGTGGGMAGPAPAGGAPGDPGAILLTGTNAGNTAGAAGIPQGPPTDPNAAAAAAAGTGKWVMPDVPNATDFNTLGTMTGRSAGKSYDVTFMSVVVDVDPASLLKLVDQLYRQNPGYTLINLQVRTVDPLERSSAGYLYGTGQVVEAEMLFECILFRSWSEQLMPEGIKRMLGGKVEQAAQ